MIYQGYLKRFLKSNLFIVSRFQLYNGTGVLLFECFALELPNRNNEVANSCIPLGSYECILHNSPKFGIVFKVLNVVNRSEILFHKGNTINDTKGCILLGSACVFDNVRLLASLTNSKIAFDKLMSLGVKKFNLKITELC